jgi:hypothetical protein
VAATPAPVHASPAAGASPEVRAAKKSRWARVLWGLGGMIVGSLVGTVVNIAVSSTGVLGPGMEDLISEQNAGFASIDAKLDALRKTSDPAQQRTITSELQTLITQQKAMAERASDELRGARSQIEQLQAELLEARGSASGVDLWLREGEGATIGAKGNVFSVLGFRPGGVVIVNAGGERKNLASGDSVEFKAGDVTWRVIYKLAERRADRRVGFDVVQVEK